MAARDQSLQALLTSGGERADGDAAWSEIRQRYSAPARAKWSLKFDSARQDGPNRVAAPADRRGVLWSDGNWAEGGRTVGAGELVPRRRVFTFR